MDPVVSDPQPREARMLAAIVFTDVVGFSKLASQNEGRVYVALQRDMGVMTNLCRAHGGQVLNTMGDGMLLCFASAVDAMSCATEIQQTLYNQSHTLPASEVLHHRIGVHLGDVIMNGDNVFGDGVNVAARLQALAKPDAICFSATVYEIVKNKLRFDAKYLGPRQLKNLGEPVRVWQIPPLGDGLARVGAGLDDTAPILQAPEAAEGARGFKGLALVLASIFLIGSLVFAFTKLKPIDHVLPKVTPRDIEREKEKEKKQAETTGGSTTGSETTITPPPSNVPDLAALNQEIEGYKTRYEFDKIVEAINRNGAASEMKEKLAVYEELSKMMVYVKDQLGKTSPTNAIPIKMENGAEGDVYLSGDQLYFTAQTTAATPVSWPPDAPSMSAIITSLAARPVDGSTAPTEALHWVVLFSSEYPPVVPTPGG